MNQKSVKRVAAIIAIVLVVAMVITSFSFVFASDSGSVVYGAQTAGSSAASGDSATSEDEYINKELDFLKLILKFLQEYYKDEVPAEVLMEGAYQGVFDTLDPYSIYYNTEEERQRFEEAVDGEYNGIGVNMEVVDGKCRIITPMAGGPAERVGILPGDIVKEVDGEKVEGLAVSEVSVKIRGPVGTSVTLTLERDGKQLSFTMVREKIKTTSVQYEKIEGTNIGYIQIAKFDSDTDTEFKNAKIMLMSEGAKSFIVDVRNNPGGLVDAAVNVASQWMPKGPICHLERQGKIFDTIEAGGPGDPGAPMVLLVNEGSASAAEILAGAWQDSKTAKLVGTTTYGKGVAQTIVPLKNGHSMKVSVYYFLTPNKRVIDKKGVTPDYVVSNRISGREGAWEEYGKFAPMSESIRPQLGDTGLNVYGAQQRLKLLGYKVGVTGTLDQDTWDAIKKFQQEKGFFPYGVLDYTTRDALEKAAGEYAAGVSERDLQMEKAIELLSGK